MGKQPYAKGSERVKRDTHRCHGHNPFFKLAEKLCKPHVLTEIQGRPRPDDGIVRIALVSMPAVPFATTDVRRAKSVRAGMDPNDVRRTLTNFSPTSVVKMRKAYKEALKAALEEHGAHIVCFNELGLPSKNMKPDDVENLVSRRHDALVIAGTAHDKVTMFNTGYLLHPPKHTHAFHKYASAVTMHERIMTPAQRRVLIVSTFGLKIAVMICLDVVDYTTFASVMRASDYVNVVLVPCYTERFEQMQDIATVASKALPGVVALVNSRQRAGSRYVAQCGEVLDPSAPQLLPGGAEIAVLSLNLNELEERRTDAKVNADPCLDWMFGSRYLPRTHEV